MMANRRTFLASLVGGAIALKELPAVMAMPVAVERDDAPELQRRIDKGEWIRNESFVLRSPITMRRRTIITGCAIDMFGDACIKFNKQSQDCEFSHCFITGTDITRACLVYDGPQEPITNLQFKGAERGD
jgi:hypothetical protein